MALHELISFNPSETVLADPAGTLSQVFKDVDGCSGLFFGRSEENKDVAFIVIDWTSAAHRRPLSSLSSISSIPSFTSITSPNSTSTSLPLSFSEPYNTSSLHAALGAPITEVAFLTPKASNTLGDLEAAVRDLLPRAAAEEGVVKPGAWSMPTGNGDGEGGGEGEGESEGGKASVVLLGWASVARHYEVIGQDKLAAIVTKLMEIVDIDMNHALFKKIL